MVALTDPLGDPRVRMEVARRLAKEHLRRAEAITYGAMERLRVRARRHVAAAAELLALAEESAIDAAVLIGEEREIEREVWG